MRQSLQPDLFSDRSEPRCAPFADDNGQPIYESPTWPGCYPTRDGKTLWRFARYRNAARPTWRKLNLHPDGGGYAHTYVKQQHRAVQVKMHRIVIETYGPPQPTPKHEVRHLDGCRTNNHIDNLAWGTRAENYADSVKHGTAVCLRPEWSDAIKKSALIRSNRARQRWRAWSPVNAPPNELAAHQRWKYDQRQRLNQLSAQLQELCARADARAGERPRLNAWGADRFALAKTLGLREEGSTSSSATPRRIEQPHES